MPLAGIPGQMAIAPTLGFDSPPVGPYSAFSMVKWIVTVFLMALFMPLAAAAAVHCDHDQGQNVPHGVDSKSVESVPAAGTAETCPDHPGQPRNTNMPHCKIKEGCCIKSDGPLSTGLSDRLPTNDDHALSILMAQPAIDVRLAKAVPHRLFLPQGRTEPDPRPPSA